MFVIVDKIIWIFKVKFLIFFYIYSMKKKWNLCVLLNWVVIVFKNVFCWIINFFLFVIFLNVVMILKKFNKKL